MKIRYDDKGQILAVGDDACDWPEPLLKLSDRDLPADLLAGMGHYAVRKGKLAKAQAAGPVAIELPAALLQAGRADGVAAVFEPGGLVTDRLPPRGRPAKKAAAAPARAKKAPAAKKTQRGK